MKDNFCQFSIKNICCGYSLESPWRGNSNEYPQHLFLWRNKQSYPLIITKYPPYLFHWGNLNQWLEEYGTRNYFMTNLHESYVAELGIELATPVLELRLQIRCTASLLPGQPEWFCYNRDYVLVPMDLSF